MKKISILIVAIIIIECITIAYLKAQTTAAGSSAHATGSAGAKLLVQIKLCKTCCLNFGPLSSQGKEAGTCTLSTTGVRTFTGGVKAGSCGQKATNAAYNVRGSVNETYEITLPDRISVTKEPACPPATLYIDNLKARTKSTGVDGITGKLNGSGEDSFKVGGTLNVPKTKVSGIFIGTYVISVEYN